MREVMMFIKIGRTCWHIGLGLTAYMSTLLSSSFYYLPTLSSSPESTSQYAVSIYYFIHPSTVLQDFLHRAGNLYPSPLSLSLLILGVSFSSSGTFIAFYGTLCPTPVYPKRMTPSSFLLIKTLSRRPCSSVFRHVHLFFPF